MNLLHNEGKHKGLIMRLTVIKDFLRLEAASGIILFFAMVLALIVSQTPWQGAYQAFLYYPLGMSFAHFSFVKPLSFWVNEGLMTLFFLLVGLELKYEKMDGELKTLSHMLLPGVAAVGGMIVPCVLYWMWNHHDPLALKGWPIPAATDIAFALGVLSLFGRRVPLTLKLFLMALAVFDDVGAIVIIALVYTTSLSCVFLLASVGVLVLLGLANHYRVEKLGIYLLLGVLLWVCVLLSGVHATVAGILLAIMIPQHMPHGKRGMSPLKRLEKKLHPWVAYGVMPLFAFANAGISLSAITPAILFSGVTFGVAIGLFVGKQVGVLSFSWLAVQCRWVSLPRDVTWRLLYCVSVLCGVGFTMSLFLGTLAFSGNDMVLNEVRLGVLGGSILSGIVAIALLSVSLRKENN